VSAGSSVSSTNVQAQAAQQVSASTDQGGPRAHVRLVANGGEIIETGYAEAEPEQLPEQLTEPEPLASPRTWREMVALTWDKVPQLHGILRNAVHLVRFSPPDVQIRLEDAQTKADRLLQSFLEEHFPGQWRISLSTAEGEPTLDEQGAEVVQLNRAAVEAHPLVKAILEAFPGAKIGDVQDHSLDEYGLPPEITAPLTEDSPPDLEFAPLDADFLDEDDLLKDQEPL